MSGGPPQTLEEGFEKFVIRKEGCWDWSGCCPDNPGYPQFRSKMKLWRAHIASWIINFGEIPKGMFVCHKCDNRRCTNPDHLFLATCKENNIDMMKKGRSPILGKSGSKNPNSKLTDIQISNIRYFLSNRFSQTKIAKMFNVSQTAISLINTGKCHSLTGGSY